MSLQAQAAYDCFRARKITDLTTADLLVWADAAEEIGNTHKAAELRDRAIWHVSRNVYYVRHPRDFANEYTVYVVPAPLVGRFEAEFEGARRISRAEAVRLGISRPRAARRQNEQWWGGLCDSPIQPEPQLGLPSVTAILDAARESTVWTLKECETEAAAHAEYDQRISAEREGR